MTQHKSQIHFIAIGGSAMHNLAIALRSLGYQITGSDDEIFEPSRSHLSQNGILPSKMGWFPDKLSGSTEAVILGMHARPDNPELLKAQSLGLNIYSFPDYIYQASQNAKRVVIAGSHGKTTITSMILHVMKYSGKPFDYLVGAGIEGFDNMVQISNAPVIILEGDEYLSSPLDRTPKFIRYNHQVGLISGISWDHINAFPTKESYINQFEKFIDNTPSDGVIIYNSEDGILAGLVEKKNRIFNTLAYQTPEYKIENNKYILKYDNDWIPLSVFGKHNMQNLAGAIKTLEVLNLDKSIIKKAIQSFKGAKNRLEPILENDKISIFKDFAHSPSKLKSTIEAASELFHGKRVIACFELHTFSSLNKKFLMEYKDTMNKADVKIVFINDHTFEIKKMPRLDDESIKNGFNDQEIIIVRKTEELKFLLRDSIVDNSVSLLMSSGNFGGLDIKEFASEFTTII